MQGNDTPLKWKKYELLASLGLSCYDHLESTIFRYKIYQLNKLAEDVCLLFTKNKNLNKLIVIKFVTKNDPGQLLNIRLEASPKVEELKQQIRSLTLPDVIEYWFCVSEIAKAPYNFSGRYLVDMRSNKSEIIEIVWWASPRLLEGDVSSLDYPYARYIKPFPMTHFQVEETNNSYKQNQQSKKICLSKVIQLLRNNRVSIYNFEAILNKSSIHVYSLEFKFENGKGQFIDWDTFDDKKVLMLTLDA